MSERVFPTHSSVLSAEALAERVLPAYGLQPPVRCRLVSRGLNDTYRVETGDGTLYLRVYRLGWRTEAETEAELALMSDLHRLGLRVSRPVPRADGMLSGRVRAAEVGGRSFSSPLPRARTSARLQLATPGRLGDWPRGSTRRPMVLSPHTRASTSTSAT